MSAGPKRVYCLWIEGQSHPYPTAKEAYLAGCSAMLRVSGEKRFLEAAAGLAGGLRQHFARDPVDLYGNPKAGKSEWAARGYEHISGVVVDVHNETKIKIKNLHFMAARLGASVYLERPKKLQNGGGAS